MKFSAFFGLSLALSLMTAFSAQALGPSTGGGGDVVILPDDSVVLADPFLNSGAPQPNNMPPVRALNPRLLQAADSYLRATLFHLELMSPKKMARPEGSYNSDIANNIKTLSVRRNHLRFYAVQSQAELNLFCAPGGRKSYVLPTGARVEQVACTAGDETFLVEPLFIRLSIKDQTLLLIHERLTTLRDAQGGKNYSAIARFTTGLGVYLSIYREQYKNHFRKLTPEEQKALTEFYIAIEEIERRDSDINEDSFQWAAAPTGGGRVHALADIADDATVGLGFVVGKNSRIGSGAFLKRGYYSSGKIPKFVVGAKTYIDEVTLNNLNVLEVGESAKVTNSKLSGSVTLGDKTELDRVKLESANSFKAGNSSKITSSAFTGSVDIGDKAELENVTLSVGYNQAASLKADSEVKLRDDAFAGTIDIDSNTVLTNVRNNGLLRTGPHNALKNVVLSGELRLGSENTFENVKLQGSLRTQDRVRVSQSVLVGNYNLQNRSLISQSNLNGFSFTLNENGVVENFKANLSKHAQSSEGVHVKNLKNGFLDDNSVEYYPTGTKLRSVRAEWKDNNKFEVKFDYVSSDTANAVESYLKGTYLANEAPLIVQVGSSFSYMTKTLFNDAYTYEIKQTKYRIEFDANQVKREQRAQAYTISNNEVVPCTGGPYMGWYGVRTAANFNDQRLMIIKRKMQELGFVQAKEDSGITYYYAPLRD